MMNWIMSHLYEIGLVAGGAAAQWSVPKLVKRAAGWAIGKLTLIR